MVEKLLANFEVKFSDIITYRRTELQYDRHEKNNIPPPPAIFDPGGHKHRKFSIVMYAYILNNSLIDVINSVYLDFNCIFSSL